MKRVLRKFVSKLNGRNKYIFFVVLVLICVMALSLGIYAQFFYKYFDTDPLMIGIHVGVKKTAEEYDLLKSNFNEIFTNTVRVNGDVGQVEKLEEEKQIIYTAYDLENEDENYYSVDAQIPIINIDTEVIDQVNLEIRNEYYNKANYVMRQNEGNTIYKVTYAGYVNSDLLSIVIKSSLKEQGKSEKVSIKTYTYSMSAEKLISLDDLIKLKETTATVVQNNINNEIKTAYENAKIIASEYGALYERDLASDMYKVEFTNEYFLTDDGYVYIVYPYGNEDYTNEMDVVIF